MNVSTEISNILKADAIKAKKLFELCEKNGEGTFQKLHIIENSRFPDQKKEYRIYHSDGFCFDVSKEQVDLAEDESCDSCIDGYEYYFEGDAFEGFKSITVEDASELLQAV